MGKGNKKKVSIRKKQRTDEELKNNPKKQVSLKNKKVWAAQKQAAQRQRVQERDTKRYV